jgi:hypothetical protein
MRVLVAVYSGARHAWFVVVARACGGRGVGVARSFSIARELAAGPSWIGGSP